MKGYSKQYYLKNRIKILRDHKERYGQYYKQYRKQKWARLKQIGDTSLMASSRDRIRELIRIRDNYTCQICGRIWIEGKRKFDVHHMDFIKEKSKQCDNFEKEKDNMITLCHKCHLNLPAHRNSMILGIKKNYPQNIPTKN